MSDHHIDQYETLSYGPFAAGQIEELAVGIDKHFDALLKHLAEQITAKTKAMHAAIDKAGGVEHVTYQDAEGSPVAGARDLLKRAVAYAGSHQGGDAVVAQILGRLTRSAIGRTRPVKLVGLLESASKAFKSRAHALGSEAAGWVKQLDASHAKLSALNGSVKTSRENRKSVTPEVQAAHADWLTSYGAAKLVTEGMLKLHGKTDLMPSIFDDLAEVHHVKGVHDDPAQAAGAGGGSQVGAGTAAGAGGAPQS